MQTYPITQEFFTRCQNYKAQKYIKPVAIMVHSVWSKGTDFNRWRKWNVESNNEKCVHGFIDGNGIYQTLPWDMLGWHAGGAANNTHISFEICEPYTDTPENRDDLYNKVLYLCVYLCRMYNIRANMVITHCEGHQLGIASNHGDVNHWWGRGMWIDHTMDRLRADIARELGEEFVPGPIVVTRPMLSRGCVGDAVRDLQQELAARGYNVGPSGVDGHFGAHTEAAVRLFQLDYALKVDGVVGPLTWAALDTDAPERPEPIAPPVTHVQLKRGAKGDVVIELQRELVARGYDIGQAKVDGIFGTATEAAVKAFQRDQGLDADGIVGPLTWAALDASDASVISESVEYQTYTVRDRDTLWAISHSFDTTMAAIMEANEIIREAHKIQAGWELRIPVAK